MNNPISYVIALYIRLSVEDNKVDSCSIDNQRRTLHHHVDTMEGVRNVKVLEFVDNGYSGTNFERPAVQELLDMVREGKIKCIIVRDFTRFGRNYIEVSYFMEKVFPLYGVQFISVNNVRLIFELARDGLDAHQIVQELLARGISTPGEYKASKGSVSYDISRCYRIWQGSTVLRILRDEWYAGTYIIGKRQVTEVGSHRVQLKDESEWIKIPDHENCQVHLNILL